MNGQHLSGSKVGRWKRHLDPRTARERPRVYRYVIVRPSFKRNLIRYSLALTGDADCLLSLTF
jgi:hypothetical protein